MVIKFILCFQVTFPNNASLFCFFFFICIFIYYLCTTDSHISVVEIDVDLVDEPEIVDLNGSSQQVN